MCTVKVTGMGRLYHKKYMGGGFSFLKSDGGVFLKKEFEKNVVQKSRGWGAKYKNGDRVSGS